MKLVVAVLIAAGCGGSSPPVQPPSQQPPVAAAPADPPPATDSANAIQAAGFNDEGVKAMYAGNYALASEHFRNAIARVPEPKYFFNLCTSLFQEGKFSEATTACAAVEAGDPTPELSEKAKKLALKIDDEAKRQGIDVRPTEPGTGPAPKSGSQAALAAKLSDEGVQLMFDKKYAEASAKFRDAVARVPEPKYFFNLCTSLFQEGKFSEALTSCGAVARNNPTPALQSKTNQMMDRIKTEAKAQGIRL
jgi:TolA-binding protein